MTVRNGMPFINDAIESIREQTFQDWEAVIVDDGSTDGTFDFLSDYLEGDGRFTLVRTLGVGRGAALNIAWRSSSGEFVCNLDADDLAHPRRAEYQVEIANAHHCDVHCGQMLCFVEIGQVNWNGLSYATPIDVSRRLMRGNQISHNAVIIRRSALEKVGGYSEQRRMQFDYDLWGRMASAGLHLVRSPSVVGARRIHALQSFENKKRLHYLYSSFVLQNRIISNLRGGTLMRMIAIVRLMYGLLPQSLRMRRRRFIVLNR